MISLLGKKRQWVQENKGDVFGLLWATRNINFDDQGYLKLARRSTALIYNQTNFGAVTSLQTLDANIYLAVTSLQLQSFSLVNNTTTSLDGTGHIGNLLFDGITWQNRWYVSQSTNFAYYDGSSWTTGLGSLSDATAYHPLCVHEGLNQLAIGEDNNLYLYNSSHSLATTIVLPKNFQVRWIRYSNNYLYIGTLNISGGDGEVFIADGSTSAWNSSARIPGCQWVFSGDIYKGVLVVISSNGQLLRYNGSGFDELARLPIYNTPQYSWYDGNGSAIGKVAQRGMIVKGELIYLNIDGSVNNSNGTQLPNQPSGLWIYDPDVGLYHHAGLAKDNYLAANFSSAINTTTNIITTSSPLPTTTGTKVLCYTTDCTGLVAGRYYYLIYLSSTTYQLASSYNNAIAGTAVNLGTGTAVNISGSNNQSFGEWANVLYQQPGAILLINDLNSTLRNYDASSASRVLFGAVVHPYVAGSPISTVQTLTTGENRGTFITTKIFSSSIKDTWQAVILKFNKLYQGNDKLIFKYRTSEVEGYPLFSVNQLTWTNSTSFTSTFDFNQVSVGDEIEFTSGRASGCSAHIVSMVNNSGIWTVIIDESMPAVTANDITFNFIINNWKKRDVIVPPVVDSYTRIADEGSSKWVQIKIEVRGVSEPYVEEVQVINKTLMPSA